MSAQSLFTAYRVLENREENAHTCSLYLDSEMAGAIPGQFVMAWLPGIGEKPFSLSGNAPVRLTVADVGPLSHALTQLQTGERLWLRGPLGQGFKLIGHTHLLLGGGYGAAPLSFLAQAALSVGDRVGVCLGACSQAELLLMKEFGALGCQVWIATEDGSAGRKGLLTDLLPEAQQAFDSQSVYACGPLGMLVAVASWAKSAHLPMQLSFEGIMRCGIGLCGSCELPEEICRQLGIPAGFLPCHDGPVYEIQPDGQI